MSKCTKAVTYLAAAAALVTLIFVVFQSTSMLAGS